MNQLPLNLTQLQLALLIFGVVIVLLVILFSRRDKGNVKTDPRGSRVIAQPRVEEPGSYGIGGEFDEFGVGRPRRRGEAPPARMPQLNIEPGPVRAAPPPKPKEPAYMSQPAPTVAPVQRRVAPTITPQPAAEKTAPTPPQKKQDEKIVTLIIARTNGVAMQGPRIHDALASCGLQFGPMQIYHRKHDGKRVFSVASLMKPGFLIPDEADGFGTMALSMFMVLPGPMEGNAALEDMLSTARQLAARLEAEVYDERRQVLSTQSEQRLRADVQAWAGVA
ncbi:MAG TPA: cell division protein ZipA C-terminal FtsZ-binding domain-containing protein [Nevskiaceae bacterium]|nr:cell division protein ZipA C-terminal FtsZ-binding domain-containing protein [Nevskiaceae bacterium]